MITIISPRIQNLGDFSNCLPALSGLYKLVGEKLHFAICDGLQQFRGLKELLLYQDMFEEVSFFGEQKFNNSNCILIDDTGSEENCGINPLSTVRYANFIKHNYQIEFEIDSDFELQIPEVQIENIEDRIIVGDRWSLKIANDLDTRRSSNLIESSGIMKDKIVHYLDYTKDLIYNCNIIKKSDLPFITTFTGIGIVADLMKKDSYILWGDDIRNWDNKLIQYSFNLHYFNNRNAKLVYLNDFDVSKI
jgi:hypothetical protein